MAVPLSRRRRPPRSNSPAVLEAAAARQRAGLPDTHSGHEPQLGTKTSTTWSPMVTSLTPAPTASTTPAASCPRTMGTGRGLLPLTTDRSEWHTPAARIRISSSPGPGPSSVSVRSSRGLDTEYGAGAPSAVRTIERVVRVGPGMRLTYHI
jgi:hypothetical protein